MKDKKNLNTIEWFWERTLFYIKARKLPPWPYRFRQIKRNIIKNNPLPILLKKLRGRNEKFAIINKWTYWMDYLENILLTDDRFILRCCSATPSPHDPAPDFNVNDPDSLNIVIGGKEFFECGYSRDVFLTKWHRVLVRIQHSPGFGFTLPDFVFMNCIRDYDWITKNGYKLMIIKSHWDFLLKSNCFPDHILKLREKVINDNVPLTFTHFDPKLNRILNSPRIIKRKPGTVLISCNFRIGISTVDIKRLLTAIDYLSKNFRITVNLHPLLKDLPELIRQPVSVLLGALQNSAVVNITTQNSIQDMINLYDEHEFIVTDGSGTVYEAIARGCKALTLDGLTYQENKDLSFSTVESGFLPKTLVWDYKNHPGAQVDMEWLRNLYPTSLVKEDVTPLVAQEIVDVFNNWHK